MAVGVSQDKQGPTWPLGNIVVATPGTPVRITNLVDSGVANAPETAVGVGAGVGNEYTSRAQQIQFQAYKVGAQPPAFALNTGLIYIIQKTTAAGSNNKTDSGCVVAILSPGQSYVLASAPLNRNVFNLYEYFIDGDTAGD